MAEKSMHARRTMVHRALGAVLALVLVGLATSGALAGPT
jgi:hypothetical protein